MAWRPRREDLGRGSARTLELAFQHHGRLHATQVARSSGVTSVPCDVPCDRGTVTGGGRRSASSDANPEDARVTRAVRVGGDRAAAPGWRAAGRASGKHRAFLPCVLSLSDVMRHVIRTF